MSSFLQIWEDVVQPAPTVMVNPGFLVQPENLIYHGCFRLPSYPPDRYDFPGKGMCYNAANNSLFCVGFASEEGCGEMTIPVPIAGAPNQNALNRAIAIQHVQDPSEGSWGSLAYGAGINMGGLLMYGGRLIVTYFRTYDATGDQPFSHWARNPNLSAPGAYVGPVTLAVTDLVNNVTPHAGMVSGYMGDIAPAWQAAFGGPCFTGQSGLSIITRTSFGPGAFAFDPANIGTVNPVPTTPLVFYPSNHQSLGTWGSEAPNDQFNGTMQTGGIVQPINTGSVLFFGVIGIGEYHYGNGTADPSLNGTLVPGYTDRYYWYDPAVPTPGDHAYPYVGRVWAYRAVDLAEVAAGTRNAWDALPYAVWTLHTDFYPTLPRFNAAAYDPATGRIFLSVDKSDGDGNGVPLIHVFTISQGVTTYALTVTNGGGSGNFAAGATVNILANTAAPGFAFDEWTGDVSTVADVNAASTTMIMPAAPATVTATYAALPTYALTVTNGTGDGSYIAGTVVHIVADAPGGGSVFDRWTGSAAIVNIFAASTTIAMPAAPTTVVATYTPPPLYALTVNSGTGDGNYAAGTVVTITADTAPPGQVFNSWVGATVADVAASTTTITMPAAAATVTATYSTTSSGLPIVPGAAGFGMDTRAAYGGATNPVVLRVTTIADSGAGSLRTALATTGPRVVIFDTSGAIELTTELVIADPYVTVAGQTAPAPGIMLKNYGLQIQTHDVLIQHLYIRPGADTCNTGVEAFITGNPYNIVLDHVSVSWSQSKNFAFTNGTHDMNLTLWKCICSEPLYNAPGRESCGGGGAGFAYGLLFRNEAKQVCVIQTLFTQCAERNPYCTGNAEAVVYNNLIYNWDHIATFFSDIDGVEPPGLTASVIGNYYKIGPTPEPDFNDCVASRFLASSAQIYIADVGKDTIPGTPLTTYHVIDGANAQVLTPPIAVADYTLLSSGTVYGQVLAQAGARVVDMDPVDVRIKNDVINRTGGFIQTPADVGGYPTFAVNTRVLSLPANPNTVTGSGYTNLEVWLQGYASVVEG